MTDYKKQAKDFLEKTGTRITCTYITTAKYFPDDKIKRDIYSVVIVRESSGKYLTLTFGDSIANTEKNYYSHARKSPDAYSILACLPNYTPETLDDFANEFGYTKPSEAIRVYKEIKRQYKQLCEMYSEPELTALREIM